MVRNRVLIAIVATLATMAIENTVSTDFFIRVRRLLIAFSIAAYPLCSRFYIFFSTAIFEKKRIECNRQLPSYFKENDFNF